MRRIFTVFLALLLIIPLLQATLSEVTLNKNTAGMTLINGALATDNCVVLKPGDAQYQAVRLDLGDINAGSWTVIYFEGLSSDVKGVALTCYSNLTAPYYVKIAYWYQDKEWRIIEAKPQLTTLASASFNPSELPNVVALALKYTGSPDNKIYAKVILADGNSIELQGSTTYYWSRYAEFGVTGGVKVVEVKAKYLWLCGDNELQTVLDKIKQLATPVFTINIINAVLPAIIILLVVGGLLKILSKVR